MAARKWYQNPKFSVPVAVALVGLIGTIVTVLWSRQEEAADKAQSDSPPATTVPASSTGTTTTVPPPFPTPPPVVSFPVVVIDDVTRDHIAGARIVADEQGVSTETDSQGRCTLSVRPGQSKLRVTVSRPGYRTQNVELTVFEGMDPARIRLQKI
jgi:hypothetical protein